MNTTNQYDDLPVVALTGNIGSGKTKAAEILQNCGASCIDADQLARDVVLPGSEGLEKIRGCFGDEVILDGGELNRQRLGEMIFQDKDRRTQLENILHPLIQKLRYERLDAIASLKAPPPLILSVIPLYFESEFAFPEVKRVVVVFAPRETCLKRIVTRDNCSLELAEAKYNAQLPIEEKVQKADYVIDNTADITHLEEQCKTLYQRILDDLSS